MGFINPTPIYIFSRPPPFKVKRGYTPLKHPIKGVFRGATSVGWEGGKIDINTPKKAPPLTNKAVITHNTLWRK